MRIAWPKRRKRRKSRDTRALLAHQIDVTIEGIDFARRVISSPDVPQNARSSMAEIEHQGDHARAEVIRVMTSRITTPLDREDLFRASRSIDDVLDNTRDFVREMSMWRAGAGTHALLACERAVGSLQNLRSAVGSVDPADVRRHCLAARKEAGQVRRIYQNGLAVIFDEELTMETLKTRELLRRLDIVGLRLTEASDALLDGLIKRAI